MDKFKTRILRLAQVVPLAMLMRPAQVLACAACGSGDPTLTVMGTEKPFAGRLRAALAFQHRTDDVGVPLVDQIKLAEQHLELELGWAPFDRLIATVGVPVVRRSVEYVDGVRRESMGLGDVELRAKFFVY